MNDQYSIDSRRICEITQAGYIPVNTELQCLDDAECIVYWMSRDQRIHDNWALLSCIRESQKRKIPIRILFTLVPEFLDATIRQYHFMLHGLEEVQQTAHSMGIPFHLILDSNPAKSAVAFTQVMKAGMMITDFDPLKIKLEWKKNACMGISCPFYEVDAHNVIPARFISQKTEFAAYTLRPKVHRLLSDFLLPYPDSSQFKQTALSIEESFTADDILKKVSVRRDVQKVNTYLPGSKSALSTLDLFIQKKLENYGVRRNDPNAEHVSDMSPWLHFGNISSQTIALKVNQQDKNKK